MTTSATPQPAPRPDTRVVPQNLDRIAVDGIELEYRQIGRREEWAPTLVFLHEGLGSAGLWRDFPDRLCQFTGCGALIVSRQGHGHSAPLPRNSDGEVDPDPDYLKHEADVVLPRVLDRFGVERALFMGHSDGGTIALMFAAQHPRRTIGCIVEAPHVMVEDITVRGIKRAGRAYASGDLKNGLAKYHADPEGVFQRWYRTWTHPSFIEWNMLNRLPQISCPVLGIQGEEDQYGSFNQLTTIRDSIAGTTHMQGFKNCGHTPHGEYPELVIDSILKFLPKCR